MMLSHFATRMKPLGLPLLLVLLSGCGAALPFGLGQAKLAGTDIQGTTAAVFTLTNAGNQRVSLAQFRGKAVALTFITPACVP
jgi:cytochrome oxidase Cu insertion factor (SCO1/SenC/PrrC family)